jgi:hypothetical protein
LVIFETGSWVYGHMAWTQSYLISPWLRWQTRTTRPGFLLRWGLANILLRLASSNNPPDLCFLRQGFTM